MSETISNLSDAARDVFPHLLAMHKRLRENLRKEIQGVADATTESLEAHSGDWSNLVELGNKIIRDEASEKEVVDFRTYFAKIKSELLIQQRGDPKATRIITNFAEKLEKSVLGGRDRLATI